MGQIYDRLAQDYRVKEGLKACISCGTCTAICPAAEFYRYNPKKIVTIVQSRDDEAIIELLKSGAARARTRPAWSSWPCAPCRSNWAISPKAKRAGSNCR